MAKYEWSEVFMSVEGEAKYTGWPTAYIRFARCNFKCKGFNNPDDHVERSGYATLTFNPKSYDDLQSIPLISKGCDSQYAVNPEFSHMWFKGDENQLADEVIKVLPHNKWSNPNSGQNVILSLTGGEPTTRIKFWPELLNTEQFKDVKHILIETNCSVPLKKDHVEALYNWAYDRDVKITWSNSPKLSSSGENWEDAIRPEIAVAQMYTESRYSYSMHFEQYFKFVCGPNEEDFNEVEKAMNEYFAAGIPRNTEVYVMPVACLEEQQQAIAAKVATMCIDRGYIYCHRVQNSVFGNGVGT